MVKTRKGFEFKDLLGMHKHNHKVGKFMVWDTFFSIDLNWDVWTRGIKNLMEFCMATVYVGHTKVYVGRRWSASHFLVKAYS